MAEDDLPRTVHVAYAAAAAAPSRGEVPAARPARAHDATSAAAVALPATTPAQANMVTSLMEYLIVLLGGGPVAAAVRGSRSLRTRLPEKACTSALGLIGAVVAGRSSRPRVRLCVLRI